MMEKYKNDMDNKQTMVTIYRYRKKGPHFVENLSLFCFLFE